MVESQPAKDNAEQKVHVPSAILKEHREPTILEEYRSRVTKIYQEKNPDKLSEVDKLLEKYKGDEHTLYLKICSKYSVSAEAQYKGNSPFGKGLMALKGPTAWVLSAGGAPPVVESRAGAATSVGTSGDVAVQVSSSNASPVQSGALLTSGSGKATQQQQRGSAGPASAAAEKLSAAAGPVERTRSRSPVPKPARGPENASVEVVMKTPQKTQLEPPAALPIKSPPLELPARSQDLSMPAASKAEACQVWAVLYHANFANSTRQEKTPVSDLLPGKIISVSSSKAKAKSAAIQDMQAKKAELLGSKFEDVGEGIVSGGAELACGFRIVGKSDEDTAKICKWFLSEHTLD